MNTGSVESYLRDGCGRCDKYQTPACKVHRWTDALVALRAILQASELEETMKWGSPTYTYGGKNVLQLVSRVDNCSLSFFKGALLADPNAELVAPGPNSQAVRLFPFESKESVLAKEASIARFLQAAITLEREGASVSFKRSPEPVPAELQALLDADASLAASFAGLTPGRQRSHILHVAGAKQSATRARRAEKCVEKIRAGRGFLDR